MSATTPTLTMDLADAMLMTDLMSNRLASFYMAGRGEDNARMEAVDEMLYALEQKTAALLATLNAAQTVALDSRLEDTRHKTRGRD